VSPDDGATSGAGDGVAGGAGRDGPAIWHVTPDGTPAEPGPEGFVHASFPTQLADTLALHFPDASGVTLLRLDPGRLGARLRLEPSRDGALFPHVYGRITSADVLEHRTLRRGADGRLGPLPADPR
jgi:uncharacterized protein (DUF952 family)